MRNTSLKIYLVGILLLVGLLAAQWTLVSAATLTGNSQQDEEPEPVTTEEAADVEDHSGQSCGECHLDYYDAWADSVHAIAYDRESFQHAWGETRNDPACLNCHTTGFQPATSTYAVENIQCEACHGTNPANHPPEPIVVRTSADICGDCHEGTFDEWEFSMHAFSEDMGAIGCATCHNPHSQKLRFDTVTELCLNCHQDNPNNPEGYEESYVHVTHNEVDFEGVEVTCASCHMYKSSSDSLHNLSDHSTRVETVPCTDCHETISQTGVSTVLVDVDTQLAEERDVLRQRVSELEDQLTADAEAEDTSDRSIIQLTQGLIVGFGIGLTLLLVLVRRGQNGGS